MKFFKNVRQSIKKFHRNEDGLEALQIVMIIAVAAEALIFVKTQWTDTIKPWATELIGGVTEFKE